MLLDLTPWNGVLFRLGMDVAASSYNRMADCKLLFHQIMSKNLQFSQSVKNADATAKLKLWRRRIGPASIDSRRRGLAQKPIDVIVGERLNALRTARGVSLDQLGAILGVTGKDVADYESGAIRVLPAQLIAICKFFQVTLQTLFPTLDRDHDPNLH